jgi:Holliday junction resolvase RusA-like endonuclease
MSLTFVVPGDAVPQGGVTAYNDKQGKARVAYKNPSALQAFRADCRSAALAAGADLLEGPVYLEAEFVLERPKNHWRTNGELKEWAPQFHTGQRPDGDKLERALWDALTTICFRDDGQVAEWSGRKRYVRVRERPHVAVYVKSLTEKEER